MPALLSNNASSHLSAAITNSATAISIESADAGKFPSPGVGQWFPLTVVDAAGNMEIMKVTARSGTALTVTRGQEGTIAKAFAAGSACDLRLTSGSLADISTQAENLNGTMSDARLPYALSAKSFPKVEIQGPYGANFWAVGSGDGATFATYNTVIGGWWGLAFEDTSSGAINGVMDLRTGILNMRGGFQVYGQTVWHAGNDGAGSGLDADLLDGQHGSYFRNASNLDNGTVPDARLPTRLNKEAELITDWNNAQSNGWFRGDHAALNSPAAGVWWIGEVQLHQENAWVFQQVHSFTTAGLETYKRVMQGGIWKPWRRVLALDENGNMAAPGGFTINGLRVATVASNIGPDDTDFPIGHTILVQTNVIVGRNQSVVPCVRAATSNEYVLPGMGGAGTPLAGTWRVAGAAFGSGSYYLARRVQ